MAPGGVRPRHPGVPRRCSPAPATDRRSGWPAARPRALPGDGLDRQSPQGAKNNDRRAPPRRGRATAAGSENPACAAAMSSPKMSHDMADWLIRPRRHLETVVIFAGSIRHRGGHLWDRRRPGGGRASAGLQGNLPGILSPLGIIFGLFVAFVAAQVWGDSDRASAAVTREASALRAGGAASGQLPRGAGVRAARVVRRHIDDVDTHEWPAMGRHQVTLTTAPPTLVEALRWRRGDEAGERRSGRRPARTGGVAGGRLRGAAATHHHQPVGRELGQVDGAARAGILHVGRHRHGHSDNRRTTAIALGIFATGIAICLVLVASHNRPFTGEISVRPDALRQVMPLEPAAR